MNISYFRSLEESLGKDVACSGTFPTSAGGCKMDIFSCFRTCKVLLTIRSCPESLKDSLDVGRAKYWL